MDDKIKRFGSRLVRVIAVMSGVAGILLMGMYLWTIVPLYINNTPDKSLVFWLSGFLFAGILAFLFAWSLWRIAREMDIKAGSS